MLSKILFKLCLVSEMLLNATRLSHEEEKSDSSPSANIHRHLENSMFGGAAVLGRSPVLQMWGARDNGCGYILRQSRNIPLGDSTFYVQGERIFKDSKTSGRCYNVSKFLHLDYKGLYIIVAWRLVEFLFCGPWAWGSLAYIHLKKCREMSGYRHTPD